MSALSRIVFASASLALAACNAQSRSFEVGVTGASTTAGDAAALDVTLGDASAPVASVNASVEEVRTQSLPPEFETPDAGLDAEPPLVEETCDTTPSLCPSTVVPDCVPQVPNAEIGIFASPSGTDGASCGAADRPCQTVKQALLRLNSTLREIVYLDLGEYQETAKLELPAGITLQGGWTQVDHRWERGCNTDAIKHSQVQSSANVALEVKEPGLARLDSLTLRTKPFAAKGESLYGIWVNAANAVLELSDVEVVTGEAGAGTAGNAGMTPAAVTVCGSGDGAAGLVGVSGSVASASKFTRDGYTPGDGHAGMNGTAGNAGRAGSDGSASCTFFDGACIGRAGTGISAAGGAPGCGGTAGTGGGAGAGGGSSVALYVSQGTVRVKGGELRAGSAGDGAEGGRAGAGGAGGVGKPAEVNRCETTCGQNVSAVGADGGNGGKGGDGGAGSGGAGGFSFALVYATDADVSETGNALNFGVAGSSQPGAAAGGAGKRYVFTP